MRSKVEISVLDIQSLEDISENVTNFDMTDHGGKLDVEIALNDKTLHLGNKRPIQHKDRYYVKIIDYQENIWRKILEVK